MNVLSTAEIESYHEQGFLLVKGFVPTDLVEQIRLEIEGVHEALANRGHVDGLAILWEDLPDGEPPKIRQLMGSQNISAAIRNIAQSEKMIGAIEDLLAEPVELFHSKLMLKAAHKGSFTPWHSDWGYWKNTFERPAQMNAFLAIDPSTLENGCIRYVPGSHHDFIEHAVFPSSAGFEIGLPGDINAFDAEPLQMEPGDVAFHGSITIHASEGNRSAHSRIMNTFAYTARDCMLEAVKARIGERADDLYREELIQL